MDTRLFIQKCLNAVPYTETWRGAGIEAYGVTSQARWPKEIKKVLFVVTGSKAVDQYAMDNGYDAIIAHHPLHTGNYVPTLTFHTCFDCCKGGMNDLWAEALGVTKDKHIDEHLGRVGRFNRPMTFGALLAKVEKFIGGQILGQVWSRDGYAKQIKSVAICTGLGGMITDLVYPHEADCYITGEMVSESAMFPALIETGHTLSEQVGVKFFQKLLKEDGVQVDCCPIGLDVYATEVASPKANQVAYNQWVPISGEAIANDALDAESYSKIPSQKRVYKEFDKKKHVR